MKRILLVEDDESLGFVISDSLEEESFDVSWRQNGEEGMKSFIEGGFDLCILDVMMPKKDGFTLAKEIRTLNETIPLIFLTARGQEEDRLRGFEIGGDDYVVKPFSMAELIHRIKRLIKRTNPGIAPKSTDSVSIGKYKFDTKNQTLTSDSTVNELTYMEVQLLRMLIQKPNETIKREDILVEIWGENDYFKGRSLDVFVSRLRKYLAADSTIQIKNIHGVGFMLVC